MKYTEFKEQVKNLGYRFYEDKSEVKVTLEQVIICTVSKEYESVLQIRPHELFQGILLRIVYALASTPLEDRVDPELYYLELDIDDRIQDIPKYLNKLGNNFSLSDKNELGGYKTKFTLAEIKELNLIGFKAVKVNE